MNWHKVWQDALHHTEIIRSRLKPLETFSKTDLSYIFLASSAVNPGNTLVRRGKVEVGKPALLLPPNLPQFEGFQSRSDYDSEAEGEREFHLDEDVQQALQFMMVRGLRFPSLKYSHHLSEIDVFEEDLSQAKAHFANRLQRQEDTSCGLILGLEEHWQLSIIIFVCTMMDRALERDLKNIIERWEQDLDED